MGCHCLLYTFIPSIDPWHTTTAQWYVHEILQPHELSVMRCLPGAIFQQDNARPHTTRVSQDCLRTVTTLPWLARFPDLSPIEHIWDHLGRRVGHPTSLNDLEASQNQTLSGISFSGFLLPSFLSGTTAQGGPWPSQEAFSRPAFFLPVFPNT
ncbi:l-Fucosyltransferase [Trichonephila clavipes]|nr:l-Fucosyltransferase [Trichonephila clavipes]